MNEDPVVIIIISAARTPMGHDGGYFKETPAPKLGVTVIKAVIERATFKSEDIDEVIMSCILPAGQGQAPTRQAALKAGLSSSTPCMIVNKMCSSDMKAIMLAHDEMLAGSYIHIIAGGMENMSCALYLIMKARVSYRLGHDQLHDHRMLNSLEDGYDKGKVMGVFAEKYAEKYQFSSEAMDKFAITSPLRVKKANRDGHFADEIVPIIIKHQKKTTIIIHDAHAMKANSGKILRLKLAFKTDGTITAANSNSISDDAAAITLMRLLEAKKLTSKPMTKIVGYFTHAQDLTWFTTALIEAMQELLKSLLEKKMSIYLKLTRHSPLSQWRL